MKKIVYFVDYFPDDTNSVADILANALDFFKGKYSQTVAKRNGYAYVKTTRETVDEIMRCSAEDFGGGQLLRSHQLTLRYLLFKGLVKVSPEKYKWALYHRANINYLKRILKKEKPDLAVCFCFSPEKDLVDLCVKYHIPYCYALYDTYLKRPNIIPDSAMEEYIIQNSLAYLIPSFFYPDYKEFYQSKKVKPYNLPLLIQPNKVEKARKTECQGFPFVYFGQLQAFRSTNEVTDIFRTLGYSLDVFTNDAVAESDTLHKHIPIKGDSLYATIAHSDFLIALDNNAPFENYLASKAYLYVSFAKPIIVFGNNEQSAIREFLKEYPCWYYHKIGDSLDGLIDFIKKYTGYKCDAMETSQYEQYLPENSLNRIYQQIMESLHEKRKDH